MRAITAGGLRLTRQKPLRRHVTHLNGAQAHGERAGPVLRVVQDIGHVSHEREAVPLPYAEIARQREVQVASPWPAHVAIVDGGVTPPELVGLMSAVRCGQGL